MQDIWTAIQENNIYNFDQNLVGQMLGYAKENKNPLLDANAYYNVIKPIKEKNGWKMDNEDKVISSFLKKYIEDNGIVVSDWNSCNAAANTLKSNNSYFSDIDNGIVISMFQNLNDISTGNNTYYGYWQVKQKFWSKNKNVSFN